MVLRLGEIQRSRGKPTITRIVNKRYRLGWKQFIQQIVDFDSLYNIVCQVHINYKEAEWQSGEMSQVVAFWQAENIALDATTYRPNLACS